MKTNKSFAGLVLFTFGAGMSHSWGQVLTTPVYMQDTPSDAGVEPNPDTGPMWVSQDIWVRNSADPGYQPYPFTEGSPPWTLPPTQDPVYRDPLKSTPNYVYVEVRNHSNVTSSGTERLRLYWAKASTGLSWPTQWVDYQPGGALTLLYGAEITKPRKNAATASAAERSAYVNAVLSVGTNAAFTFPNGSDYWHTQQTVHQGMGSFSNIHETLAFLPWHREFVNRFEVALQQFDPTVKLLYWDWTTDPSGLDTATFMGNASGAIGAPFNPASPPTLAPPTVTRGLSGSPPAESDTAVLARDPYSPFAPLTSFPPPATAPFMVALEDYSHNFSHGYIGGSSGNMSFPSISAQDPFFFLLHGNVDRLWAQWQRNPSHVARIDPTQTYGASLGADVNLSLTMSPWDGSPGGSTSASNFQIQPWETTTPAPSGGNYVVAKSPDDPSVVSPPIYDVAPLTIPVLQPGQAVVLQIPWYPPNPANFASFGADQYHFCLLARIETSTTAPFGMTTPETSDVFANTKNNNHIVWKNISVVNQLAGPHAPFPILIRNVFEQPVKTGLRFAANQKFEGSLFENGRVFVDLPLELYKRWREGGSVGRGVKPVDDGEPGRLEIEGLSAFLQNIALNLGEAFPVSFHLELRKGYPLGTRPATEVDIIQTGAPGNPDAIVGGQRFALDFSRLVLVKSGDEWRYWDRGKYPGQKWASLSYADSKWGIGAAPFGFGHKPATTVYKGPAEHHYIATYFRHTFNVADPSFYRTALLRVMRADGAIVYLNGKEVYRANLPAGKLKAQALAKRDLSALAGEVFFPVKIDSALLRPGKNVIAAEIHLHSPRSEDMRFDLEVSANNSEIGFSPDINFVGLSDGVQVQTGEMVPVHLEALSSDGKIESVSLYVDGKLIGTVKQAPYTFNWRAESNGPHRLRVAAVDSRGMQSDSFRTVTVVEKLLPTVKMILPPSRAAVAVGQPIPVSAEASSRNGKIERVEFWVKDMATFTSPSILVATVKSQPYRATIKDLKPGHYMVWVIAVNDRGGSTQSFPGHIAVNERK